MEILGFDAGGSSVKYAVVDEKGRIREKGKFATPQDSLESLLCSLKEIKDMLQKQYTFAGAGFSLPGAVDDRTGVIGGSSSIPYIHNFDLKTRLQQTLELPAAMENDANCAALGECWLGAAAGCKDVVFLVCGSGIGGAVIKDGRIHHGTHLHGGEFGYMVVNDEAMILSEAAATVPMVRRLEKSKGLPEGSLDGEKAFQLREAGDADAMAAIDFMYDHLARAVYNLQYAYDPEITVIGGGISARPELKDELDQRIAKILAKVQIAKVVPQAACCKFGNDANILGAVYNFLQQKG